jgi:hypothetical protein
MPTPPPSPGFQVPGTITLSSPSVTAGSTVTITGKGFKSGATVTLTLDNDGPRLGTVTAGDDRGFSTTVTIPSTTTVGIHTIHATVPGFASSDSTVQVTAPGARGTLTLVWLGDNQATSDITTSSSGNTNEYRLEGKGFTPGKLTINLESVSGSQLATATAGADGSFNVVFRVNRSQVTPGHYGATKLVAVQNGAVVGELPVTLYLDEIIG